MNISYQDIENLSISKNKEVLNIVFVGHVDSGKSTICGQILVLENIVDSRTLEKYKEASKESGRESWYLSWCVDTNPEERDRGKTTELGIASFNLKNRKINILDSPGHKQYIFEMIQGANSADVGILVVSARISEFEAGFEKQGQTKEHILLMKSSSIQKVVVLINKMDDSSVLWNINRYNEIVKKLGAYMKNLFKDIVFIPVSGLKGTNIKSISNKDSIILDTNTDNPINTRNIDTTSYPSSWYKGPTLYEYLSTVEIEQKDTTRLDIILIEKTRGVVTGRVEGGVLRKDSSVKLIPQDIILTVQDIYTLDDVEVEQGYPGETIRIKLSKMEDINIGNRLVDIDNSEYKMSSIFTSRFTLLECEGVMCAGYTCMLHVGVTSVQCKIKEIRTLDNKRVIYTKAVSKVLLKIETCKEILLCVEKNKEKFSLRLGEKTLGVGIIRRVLYNK